MIKKEDTNYIKDCEGTNAIIRISSNGDYHGKKIVSINILCMLGVNSKKISFVYYF